MKTIIQLVPEDKTPAHPIRVLGIDLGTTNSTVAEIIWNPDDSKQIEARCIEIEQFTYQGTYTNLTVPSVVAIYEGKVIVGEGAKRLRADAFEKGLSQNENLFYECKNDIGVKKTYHRAEEGFRSASEIGGKLLEFLICTNCYCLWRGLSCFAIGNVFKRLYSTSMSR